KTAKYLPTCCENRAASRYLSRMTFWFLNGPVRHLLCSPESRAALKLRMCSTLQNTRSLCSAYITSTGLRNAMIICALGLKALTSWAAFLEPRYAVEASPILFSFRAAAKQLRYSARL